MKFQLTQLSEHVWYCPHDPDGAAVQSCVGVIATRDEYLLAKVNAFPLAALGDFVREIESTDKTIDRLVYELSRKGMTYGLTEDDVKAVEERSSDGARFH